MSRGEPSGARTARILHTAIVVAAVSAILVLVAVRGSGVVAPDLPPHDRNLPRALVLTVLATATFVLRRVYASLPPFAGPPEQWWSVSLGRAVVLWALADGLGLLGAVGYLLTGDLLVLALAVVWAGAMFVRYAPGRLTNG